MAMRLILVVLLAFVTGCGQEEVVQNDAAEDLRNEIAALKEEKAQKEAREKALVDQLAHEAEQKVELIKELERVKPMVDRVEAAELRVEEMIKEKKKLE